MRVLIISSEFPPGPGGIGNHAHHLALNLHRLGWKVAVVSPQDYAADEAVNKFNSSQPFQLCRVSSGRGRIGQAWERLRVARRVARELQPDILLGTGLSGVWVTAMLGLILRLPAVAVAHGSEFGQGAGLSRRINRWAFGRMKALVAVSRFTRGVLERAGIRSRRTEVISNAADQSRFTLLPESERQLFRQKAGFNRQPLLVTVGHVSERKGQAVVIQALAEIVKQKPDTHYVMIGLPTLKPQLTQLAEQLKVADRIHFLGNVANEDMVSWLNCCDIFLMTSRVTADGDCEGFGIAVVEAALCGKPAIVSNNSGLVEAISDGVTGFAVPEGDASATAKAVVSLLLNPAQRQTMGDAARARATQEQTWETCVLKYDALFKEILNSRVSGS